MRIALLGLGTVGAAVARGLSERRTELARAAGGRALDLVAVGVREPHRARSVPLPPTVAPVADLDRLVEDDSVDAVVELIGGVERAGELVAGALSRGKAVVTANKALLARRGRDLERLARGSGAALRFEGAVAGGVPVLAPLARDLAANRFTSAEGIVNGTTNHILTAMTQEGRAYADVLADAQARGYAEADPSGDVEGRDAADKLTLLARLAFGVWLEVGGIRRYPPRVRGEGAPGITAVTAADIEGARRLGLTLKLVARVATARDGLVASVLPTAVPSTSVLGMTGGVKNIVALHGDPVGSVELAGPGAGGGATSSAVLADLLALATGEGSTWAALPEAEIAGRSHDGLERPQRWYLTTAAGDGRLAQAAREARGAAVEGRVTPPMTLTEARETLGGLDPSFDATLYPVLDG